MQSRCKSLAALRSIMYVTRENEEAQMEKYRFYVELPGDLWEDGTFMDLIRMNAAPLVRLRCYQGSRVHVANGRAY